MSRIAWLLSGQELYVIDSPRSKSTDTNKDEIQTFTTTIFTPGNNKKQQAIAIKEVADNFLGATGAVLGGAAALVSSPGAFSLGVQSGEQAGRNVGSVMWNIIDSSIWNGPGNLAGRFNKGQHYGEKGWRSSSGL